MLVSRGDRAASNQRVSGCFDPARDLLYVARFSPEQDVPNSLAVVQRSTMVQLTEIETPFKAPCALALDFQANEKIYAVSFTDNRVLAIETENGRQETTVLSSVGEGRTHLALTPITDRLYVPAALSNELLVIELSAGNLISRVPVGEMPWRVAVSPDGSRVFVCNLGSNSVAVVNATTLAIEKSITGKGLAGPNDLAVSADGQYLFVSNRNASGVYQARRHLSDNERIGTVVVINTATYDIEKIIEVEEYATGMALSIN